MTEKEIMKQIKNDLNIGEFYGITEDAIKGLLDLYNKQKEENNKNYYEWRHLEAEVSNNYISKDKIRDKIKNEEKEIKEIEYLQKIDNTMGLCDEKAYRQHKIDILKQLLEER